MNETADAEKRMDGQAESDASFDARSGVVDIDALMSTETLSSAEKARRLRQEETRLRAIAADESRRLGSGEAARLASVMEALAKLERV